MMGFGGMGMMPPPQFGPPGGKGGSKGWQPPQHSATAYLTRDLKDADAETFSGAALVPYRKKDSGIELLLAWEKPWNVLTSSYDKLSWHTMGGKRIMRQERSVSATAFRCFQEAAGEGVELPSSDEMGKLTEDAFMMWYPPGRFVMVFFEAKDDVFSDLPEKFAKAREANPPTEEEFKINADGVKKWTKQIESLEWVPASDLIPEAKKDCSDLVKNMMLIQDVADFLKGTADPASTLPPRDPTKKFGEPAGKAPKGGKGGKGGKDKGAKGGGKFKKGFGKMGPGPMMQKGYGGNGFGMYAQKGMPMPMPMPAPPMMPDLEPRNDQEMQLQLYGEQLFILIQPLVPNQYVAQKITGMLLELPPNELIANLTNHEELSRRVSEAVDLLKEDGIV